MICMIAPNLQKPVTFIYHKKHNSDSESENTCTSDDDTNALERSRETKKKHKLKCSKCLKCIISLL